MLPKIRNPRHDVVPGTAADSGSGRRYHLTISAIFRMAGADVFVAGAAVFDGDYAGTIRAMKGKSEDNARRKGTDPPKPRSAAAKRPPLSTESKRDSGIYFFVYRKRPSRLPAQASGPDQL